MAARNDAPPLNLVNVALWENEAQCKRPAQGIWKWQTRIYVPCPLAFKNEFVRLARSNSVSQAELGLIILQHAIEESEATQAVINTYLRGGKQFDRNGGKR